VGGGKEAGEETEEVSQAKWRRKGASEQSDATRPTPSLCHSLPSSTLSNTRFAVQGGGKPAPPITTTNAPPASKKNDGKWAPSEEWVKELKSHIPLETLDRLLSTLMPKVDGLMKTSDGVIDEKEIIAFIHSSTVVGLLPVPHPLIIRKYQPNPYTDSWFTSYLWGVVFLRNQRLPIFDGESIKLFSVNGSL